MYDKIIEIGIIVLLIYTPLALGGVTQGSITLLEIISGVLLIVWLAKVISQRKEILPLILSSKNGYKRRSQQNKYHLPRIKTLFLGMICLFFVFILLQLVPLPRFLVKILSPATYHLYTEGAFHTGSTLPSLLPLSVCPQATETELYKVLAYAIVFFLVIMTFRTSKQIDRLIYVIITVGLLESLYGLIQFVSGSHLIYFYTTKDPWVHGTFWNRNHFAGHMELVILLAFGVLFTRFEKQSPSRLVLSIDSIREKYPKAFLLLLGALIMICAHVLSGSRGGMISLSLGVIFFTLLAYTRRLLRKWVVILLIFLPVAFGITVAANPDLISRRLSTLKQLDTDLSFRARWELWKTAGHIFQDFPIVGSGFGTFSHLARRYQTFRSETFFRYPENDYLQLLAETGILGMALVVVMGLIFLYQTLTAWKRRRSRWAVAIVAGGLGAMVSLLMHSWTDFNLHIPSNALLFTVVAALSYVTAHLWRTEGKKDRGWGAEDRGQKTIPSLQYPATSSQSFPFNIRRSPYCIVIPVFVVVLFYLFRVTESYVAFGHYRQFTEALSTDESPSVAAIQTDALTRPLRSAIRHDRNHAEYAYALGSYLYRYYEATQDSNALASKDQGVREAEGWLQKAIMLDPANPWYYYEMGCLSNDRGDCTPPSPPYWRSKRGDVPLPDISQRH